MKLKLKKLLIILAVLVLIVGGYWLYKEGFFNKFKTVQDEAAWRLQQEQAVAQLIKAGDFDACREVDYKSTDGVDYRTICQNNIALNKANESLDLIWCDKLDDQLIKKSDCENQILGRKLVVEENISVCDSATTVDLKNECQNIFWFQESINKGDISFCSRVNGEKEQLSCKENFNIEQLIKLPSQFNCSVFGGLLKSDCENFKDVKTGKISSERKALVCDQLFDFRLQSVCGIN